MLGMIFLIVIEPLVLAGPPKTSWYAFAVESTAPPADTTMPMEVVSSATHAGTFHCDARLAAVPTRVMIHILLPALLTRVRRIANDMGAGDPTGIGRGAMIPAPV